MDVKKQMNFERKLSKEDREIYSCLKPFSRFMEESQFNDIFEGFVLEKNLRQRLNQLKYYREMGLKTYDEIEKFLESENRSKKEEKKNPNTFDNDGLRNSVERFLNKNNSKFILENEFEENLVKYCDIDKGEIEDFSKELCKEYLGDGSNFIFLFLIYLIF